jgi:20S proteasome subunit alpha 6
MNMSRGGGSGGRVGRGGMYGNNNRGGGNAGQNGGNFRNHARGGFGNRDHGNRRGGSFNAGVYSHQQGSSFRGRYNRSGRHDGGSFTARDSNASGSKKEDPKRTMTEFKLVGLEIQGLSWSWGTLPLPSLKPESHEALVSTEPIKLEADDSALPAEDSAPSVNGADMNLKTESSNPAPPAPTSEVPGSIQDGAPVDSTLSPPSRIRIYFHTPVTAEDAAPIPHASTLPIDASSVSLMSTRRGKRKRADDEDDDGDLDGSHHPEPSADGDAMSVTGGASLDGTGRGSVAPSVAETVSEGDWLMAAIGDDENDEDTSNVDDDKLEIHIAEDHHDGESDVRIIRSMWHDEETKSTFLTFISLKAVMLMILT